MSMLSKLAYVIPNRFVFASPVGVELHTHDRDVMMPDPVIMKPTEKVRAVQTMDDVTNFPHQRVVELAESRPYEEGKYRPPSMPAYAGIYPTHMYL